MAELYPLRFEPLFRRYLWGGRRLATVLGKPIGAGNDYAESWEIVDHGEDQSVVSDGPLAGLTLGQVVAHHGSELLGRDNPARQFPLLFKFLDANRHLSVQVHPNDVAAAQLDPPDLGKTEAWVVLDAEPESTIYAGLKRGFDREALLREVTHGTTERCLHQIKPQVGDCIFIPAGVVHAIGAGLLIAEIQQASDTSYRLFDWNRVGPDGHPRQLHVPQALDVINFDYGPVSVQTPQLTGDPAVARLIECEKFVLDRWQLDESRSIGGDERFHLLAVLEGMVVVEGDPCEEPLRKGNTCLLPAMASSRLTPRGSTTILDMYLP